MINFNLLGKIIRSKNTFLSNYLNILSHQRSTVVVIEFQHHSITQIIAVPPFVAPQYNQLNDTDSYNRTSENRRKHMRAQVSNKFISDIQFILITLLCQCVAYLYTLYM